MAERTKFSVRQRYNRRKAVKARRAVAKKPVDKRQDQALLKLFKMVRYSKELKYVDQQLQTVASTTWTNMLTRPLTYIPEGTTVGTRIGNKIMIHRIQLKSVVTVGDATNLYRILIIKFGHCPTGSLGIQNVLENYNNTTPFQIMGFFKRNAPSKYKVLYDSGVQSLVGDGAAGSTRTIHSQRQHNIVLKFPRGELVQYSGSAANTETNGFTYAVCVSDSTLAPNVGFQTMSRVIFSG